MTSRTVTNFLLGVIAISLAGPQVVGFVRDRLENWEYERYLKKDADEQEAQRVEACKKGPGDWGEIPGKFITDEGDVVLYKVPHEIAVQNCISKTRPTHDQVERKLWELR